jgi:DnaJ-class molecular chaperone
VNLEELKRQRANLDRQIAQAEKTEAEQKLALTLAASYVKVVCSGCNGRGEVGFMGGSDNSDMETRDCDDCHGRGYLYGRAWDGKKFYDMDHNQVTAP